MTLAIIFILSGVAIATLTLAKRIEMKGRKPLFLLKAVSRGDERARYLYHKGLRFYSEGKHKFLFFIKKQLPTRVKIYLSKSITWIKERGEKRFGNIRNSRLIKRSDGISEFFKSISEVEKGAGELHDDVYIEEVHVVEAVRAVPEAFVSEATPEKKKRASRKPRVKKIKVEVVE